MVYNNFEYEIDDGQVIIIGYTNNSVESIVIPEFIEGYPVTSLWEHSFSMCEFLLSITIPISVDTIERSILFNCESIYRINGVEVINDFCIINNKFIYDNEIISKIIYQIGNDYYIECYVSYVFPDTYYYYIDDYMYDDEFKF